MTTSQIQPLAICLFRNTEKILVAEYEDPIKGEIFYRPLGGGIKFGEYADQTIMRELREEIGAEVAEVQYLFTLENIFTYQGEIGHEIVMVFDGRFTDASLYSREAIHGHEEGDFSFTAYWKSLNDFIPGHQILYPDGLLERLQRKTD